MLEQLLIQGNSSIREAMVRLTKGNCGIILLVDEKRKLQDVITDGDIRRGILDGLALESSIAEVIEIKHRRHGQNHSQPVAAPEHADTANRLLLMQKSGVHQLPILDADGRVVDLVTIDQLTAISSAPMQALIMAGGVGKRLRPLTESIPKPMLPVGGRPILEHHVERLAALGVQEVFISTHYRSEMIHDHFGDGGAFGVTIRYIEEERQMGTAGALGMIPGGPAGTILMLNADIMTSLDYLSMIRFHQEHRSGLTIGVRGYEMQVPYGVVNSDGVSVISIEEKPQFTFNVNVGVYILEPEVIRLVRPNEPIDMPDLINQALAEHLPIVSFPILEYWIDIGRHDDYHQANQDAQQGRLNL